MIAAPNMPPWKPPPPILQRPRQRTNLPNDWLGESTRHQSKLAILVVLSHDLTLQDYVPSVVRVALATRSQITTNVKTTIQTQIHQQINNKKYRWCVARPASPYQLIITRDAATLKGGGMPPQSKIGGERIRTTRVRLLPSRRGVRPRC